MVYFFKLYSIKSIEELNEYCYYIETSINKSDINEQTWTLLYELITQSNTYLISSNSFLELSNVDIKEFGPNLSASTAWSCNAMSIIKNSSIEIINKIERSIRTIDKEYFDKTFDKMTQTIYLKSLISFSASENKIQTYQQNVLYKEPVVVLNKDIKKYNDLFGLNISDKDLEYYYEIFKKMGRDTNTTELVTLATLNTEHIRHRLFRGNYTLYHLQINNTEILKMNDPLYCRTICAKYIKEHDKESLIDKIKKPYYFNKNNSIIAFRDNASAILGFKLAQLNQFWNPLVEMINNIPDDDDDDSSTFNIKSDIYMKNRKISVVQRLYHITLKAETNNFPTEVAPFEGASTCVGGRIRNTISIGTGGFMVAGMVGYSIGNLKTNTDPKSPDYISELNNSPIEILLKASDGASDYGNKIGEPIILGFTRSFGETLHYREVVPEKQPQTDNKFQRFNVTSKTERKEWLKPIMFSAGIGFISDDHLEKTCIDNLTIVQIGGPAYRIGINCGKVSSKHQNSSNKQINYAGVQRGDPEMESKLVKFINSCLLMGYNNPIMSIHNQGTGGMANVIAKICENYGACVHMSMVNRGDYSLSDMETWFAEYQEQVTILATTANLQILKFFADREKVPMSIIGNINNEQKLTIFSTVNVENNQHDALKQFYMSDDDDYEEEEKLIKMIHLPIDTIERNIPRNEYNMVEPYYKWNWGKWCNIIPTKKFMEVTKTILSNINVGSKRFLTSKVDRSIGMVSQQQTIGIAQIPLSDYAIVASNYFGVATHNDASITFPGVVTSIGEQPIKGIYDINKMVRLTVAEMLTNMIWAGIEDFSMIRCAANWMWSIEDDTDKFLLHKAVTVLSDTLADLGIAIDGGKDSLSMSFKTKNKTIKSPNTLVLTGYATTNNIMQKVNAGFTSSFNHIIYINLSHKNNRLGGSIMAQEYNGLSETENSDIPDFETLKKFPILFEYIQYHIKVGNIVAGHDISDGGLITALAEMCFPNNLGCQISFEGMGFNNCYSSFMSEEPGLLIEYNISNNHTAFIQEIKEIGYNQVYDLGIVTDEKIIISYRNEKLINCHIYELQKAWEEPSLQMEIKQIGEKLATLEFDNLLIHPLNDKLYNLSNNIIDRLSTFENDLLLLDKILYPSSINYLFCPKVAIIREEGSNGDREMKAAFMLAGFQVYDIHMNDLLQDKISLKSFNGIAFVGGFSYSDTFGGGQGWASSVNTNPLLKTQFKDFYNRYDTFSIGVSNGCQLMSLLNWVPFESKFIQNDSKRFESRYSLVKIQKNNSIMLESLEGVQFGIWSAHGEGKYYSEKVNMDISKNEFKSNPIYKNSFPVRYIDYNMTPSEIYPYNPNGSPQGIASVISDNGRHLAMMPHPERSCFTWQLAYCPLEYKTQLQNLSPWFIMFRNAFNWCEKNQNNLIDQIDNYSSTPMISDDLPYD